MRAIDSLIDADRCARCGRELGFFDGELCCDCEHGLGVGFDDELMLLSGRIDEEEGRRIAAAEGRRFE